MGSSASEKRSWGQIIRTWTHPRVITMLFLGFSAGIPILLIFSTLSVWLTEAGVGRSAVTFFSWAALGYSFKFVWAPLIDKLPLPFLTNLLGRRRAWMLVSQSLIIAAIVCMASVDPAASEKALTLMALSAVLLGFSSATQDIVIDAYRIECIDESFQALLSATYIAGYRIGMVVAGAGSLFIASFFGTTSEVYVYSAWQSTYQVIAGTMLIGVFTTLLIPEPEQNRDPAIYRYSSEQYLRLFFVFLAACTVFCTSFFYSGGIFFTLKQSLSGMLWNGVNLAGFFSETLRLALAILSAAFTVFVLVKLDVAEEVMVVETYVEPIREFFTRYGVKTAILILSLIGFYRVSDIVLGVVSNVFYVDLGFSKNVIAGITKLYGVGMTILGGFLGGMLTLRYGVYAILFLGALLSAGTNLLFMLLADSGSDIALLTVVIAVDNLSGGLAATAFVAFLSSLTNISFTAVQYALFSSLMTLFPKLFGGYSGTIVTNFGYNNFFLLTATMGVPVLLLIWLTRRKVASGED
ncbi:MAG: MFS transporter [Desulfocapsaceae bacterium]|nr:MFS transporter [Desulfocapsaceae bacterium]